MTRGVVSGGVEAAVLGSTAQRADGRVGDDDFTAAVAEHHGELARFAYRLCGDRILAEDIVAEAYARVWPHWRRGRVDVLLPYLMRSVANEAYARHRRRRLELSKEPAWTPSAQGRFEDQVGDHDELWAALQHLPEQQRLVLMLRVVEDLSEEQTAAILGIAPGTVKSRLSRGLSGLRLLLAAAAVAVAIVVAVVATRDDHDDSVRMTDPPIGPSSTIDSSTTTPTTTTTTPSGGPNVATLGPQVSTLTPLSPTGVGPIEAGMSVEEANAAAGVTISVASARNGCAEGTIPEAESIRLAIDPNGPGGGTVQAASGAVTTTDDVAMVGTMRDELIASFGQPDRTQAATSLWEDGELLIYERDGGALGLLLSDDMVLGLASGNPDWFFDADGCL